jgi:hypothetical protein
MPLDGWAGQRWQHLAEGVEAYREEWGVKPERLHERPNDPLQRQRWRASVREPVRTAQLLERQAERKLRRARGREHGHSDGVGRDL